jgi:D-serine deaminase-like pyridoxal phosphate-dependent protein
VSIAPNKLDHVFDLRRRGANLTIILDNLEIAQLVAAKSVERHDALPVLIEIDTDDHRSGIKPPDQTLIAIGRTLHTGGALLRGVLTMPAVPTACTTRRRSRRWLNGSGLASWRLRRHSERPDCRAPR